jgi:hypothetical protein
MSAHFQRTYTNVTRTIAPHGIPNVASATGISGNIKTINNPSATLLIRADDRPSNSVNRAINIPAIIAIKENPEISSIDAIPSSLTDGWNAITPTVTAKIITQPVIIRSRTLVLIAVQIIQLLPNRQHE